MCYFLSFLCANSITFSYASATLFLFFKALRSDCTHDRTSTSSVQLWLIALRKLPWLGALFLFVSICNLLVSSFLIYHLYLVFCGLTTNESLKFEDIRYAINAGEMCLYNRGDRFVLDHPGKGTEIGWNELENVYDKGWKRNICDIFS